MWDITSTVQMQARPVRTGKSPTCTWNPPTPLVQKLAADTPKPPAPRGVTPSLHGQIPTVQAHFTPVRRTEFPYLTKAHSNCHKFSPQLWQRLSPGSVIIPTARNIDYKDQKIKEETKTNDQHSDPTTATRKIQKLVPRPGCQCKNTTNNI